MNFKDLNVLIEALKEPLRLLVLAFVDYLLVDGILDGVLGIVRDPGTKMALKAGLLMALRFVDAYLHQLGKELSTKKSESWLLKGLVRF